MKTSTTALLAAAALGTAGAVSAAEVDIEGKAEVGIAGSKDDSIRFHTDIDATFKMSGETDFGLSFMTEIDLSEVDGVKDDATSNDDEHGGIAITLSHDMFGNITLGDTDSAYDWALAEVGLGGSLRDDHTEHAGYSGNGGWDGVHGGQILRWDNEYGNENSKFKFGVSAELDDEIAEDDPLDPARQIGDDDPLLTIGAQYESTLAGGASINIGAGYQTGTDEHIFDYSFSDPEIYTNLNHSAIGMSVELDFGNGLETVLNYSRMTSDGTVWSVPSTATVGFDQSDTHIGIGVGYTIGDTMIAANWGGWETTAVVDNDITMQSYFVSETWDERGFGFSVTHDLGGGAELQFGAGSGKSKIDQEFPDAALTVHEETEDGIWSLGLAFEF